MVDFAGKGEFERPDFYILTVQDWIDFLKKEMANYPKKHIKLDERNVPVWLDEVNKSGKPYQGMGVKPERIQHHKEKWDKISQALGYRSP